MEHMVVGLAEPSNLVKVGMKNPGVAHSQGCVALGVKRAFRQVSELRPLAVCKTLVLHQRQNALAALVATCLWAIPTGSPRLDLTSTVFFLPLSLAC